MRNLNSISVLFMIFIIESSRFFVETQDYTSNTYNISEKGQYNNTGVVFSDGRKILRFHIPINESCYEPNLHLRLLHKNETSSSFEVENFSPSSLNFCYDPYNDSMDYFIIQVFGDYLFILYYNISESEPTAPFGQSALQVNLEGKIVSETWLAPASYENNIIVSGGTITAISDTSFLYLVQNEYLSWKKFDITGDRLDLSGNGTASFEELSVLSQNQTCTPFGAFYNGFGCIFAITSQDYTTINSLKPSLSVYVTFFKPEINRFTKSFIIYQTAIANVDMVFAHCNPDFISIEFKCLIQLRTTSSTIIDNFLLISFLSSGSVINIEEIPAYVNGVAAFIDFISLPYGGYFSVYITQNVEGCIFSGDIIDNNNKWYSKWNISVVSKQCDYFPLIVENNFDIISEITPNSLTIITPTFPKFINDGRSSKIIAANIDSTDPPFNSTIQLGTNLLEINYVVIVLPSTQNITIYQVSGTNIVMRQTKSGQSCSVDSDHKTISLEVLPSTFNTPNSEYYVSIDSDFVKSEINNEPILGLNPSIWSFYTESKKDLYAGPYFGSVRLTPEGTAFFKNLSDLKQAEFINQLKQEISLILPVDFDRLISTQSYQIDMSTPLDQIIISLQIKDTHDLSKRNSDNLQKDLNTMIQHKDVTGISKYDHISFLDDTYGYKLNVSIKMIIQSNEVTLIIFATVFVILSGIFLWAKKYNNEAKNIIVFQLTLTIVDFILDILFIYHNGHDIPGIYTPSLTFLIVPISLNFIIVVSLMIYENLYNAPFHDWFKLHVSVASISTILGAANIEMLNILSSKFAGLNMFSINYLEKTELLLFWFGLLNLIIKDIPQFVIQIYYKTNIVSYNFIPFLTLITSSLAITLNVTRRSYMLVIQWKEQKEQRQQSAAKAAKTTDTFGDLNNPIIKNESKDCITEITKVEIQK